MEKKIIKVVLKVSKSAWGVACHGMFYAPKLPESLQKLRKEK